MAPTMKASELEVEYRSLEGEVEAPGDDDVAGDLGDGVLEGCAHARAAQGALHDPAAQRDLGETDQRAQRGQRQDTRRG